jgi:hypothetical protein
MGKGRTTTGMILACLIKDILFGDSEKIYFKESDLVNPKDYSDEEEAAEEVILFCLSVCLFVFVSVSLFLFLSFSKCVSLSLSVSFFVYFSLCLSLLLYLVNPKDFSSAEVVISFFVCLSVSKSSLYLPFCFSVCMFVCLSLSYLSHQAKRLF